MTFTDSERKTSFSFLHSFIWASPFVATSEIQYVCIGLSVQILKTESQRLNIVQKRWCTVWGVLSFAMFFLFFWKFQLPIGLHNSCSISPTAGGTCKKYLTKHHEWGDAPECMWSTVLSVNKWPYRHILETDRNQNFFYLPKPNILLKPN